MLITPFLIGTVERLRVAPDAAWLIPLFITWMAGYGFFNAASQWLKAPARRRRPWLTPMTVYGGVCALAGLVTGAWVGWDLVLWGIVYVPLLLPALGLAWRRRDRSLLGGGLTVAAACLMILVARYPHAAELLGMWQSPGGQRVLGVTVMVFGYFFGTVLYVKTMIRERGQLGWLAASIGWHVALAVTTGAAAGNGSVPWWWCGLFTFTALRAVGMPWLAARRDKPLSAKVVGFVEVGITVALLAGFLLAG